MSHIAVDMDDVVVDFIGGVLKVIKNEHDVDIPFQETGQHGWDISPLFDPIVGRPWLNEWLRDRAWLWATFDTVPGALGGLRQLRDAGHALELVTSKPEWAEWVTWDWLAKWRPPIQRVTIVPPGVSKADATTAELLIDDKPSNCAQFLDQGRDAILFARPHNQTERDSFITAHTWAEVLTLVENPDHGR